MNKSLTFNCKHEVMTLTERAILEGVNNQTILEALAEGYNGYDMN